MEAREGIRWFPIVLQTEIKGQSYCSARTRKEGSFGTTFEEIPCKNFLLQRLIERDPLGGSSCLISSGQRGRANFLVASAVTCS